MKGQYLHEMINNVDDDLLLDAMPPAWQKGKKATVCKPLSTLGRAMGRMMNSGVAAAVLSGVVAVGVLTAIVLAGQSQPQPPAQGSPAGQISATTSAPAKQDGVEVLEGNVTEAPALIPNTEGQPIEDAVVLLPGESEPPISPVDTVAPAPDNTLVHPVELVVRMKLDVIHDLTADGMEIRQELSDLYGQDESFGLDHRMAEKYLQAIAGELSVNACLVPRGCRYIELSLPDTDVYQDLRVKNFVLFDAEFEHVVGGSLGGDPAILDTTWMREHAGNTFYLVFSAYRSVTLDDGRVAYRDCTYPVAFRLEEGELTAPEAFVKDSVKSYPSTYLNLIDDEIRAAVYELDLSDTAAVEAFAIRIGETSNREVCVEDAVCLVRFLRAVPLPMHDGELPGNIIYHESGCGMSFYFIHNGRCYDFEMVTDPAYANELLSGTLNLLDKPVYINEDMTLLSAYYKGAPSFRGWMDFDGVLTRVTIRDGEESMEGLTLAEIFEGITARSVSESN